LLFGQLALHGRVNEAAAASLLFLLGLSYLFKAEHEGLLLDSHGKLVMELALQVVQF